MTFEETIEKIFSLHITLPDIWVIVGIIGCVLVSGLMLFSKLNRPLLWNLAGILFGITVINVLNIEFVLAAFILIFEIVILFLGGLYAR